VIYFITGPVNSGKTTRMLNIYASQNKGDGFYLKKVYKGPYYAGQRIVRLSTNFSLPFSYIDHYEPANWDQACRYKNYSFSLSAIAFARSVAASRANPFFIDELGPLELCGEGFYDITLELIKSTTDLYAVVRAECLFAIIKKFDIKNYSII